MNLLLDTCTVRRNDIGESRNKKIDYDVLENIIEDKNNQLFITPFSYANCLPFARTANYGCLIAWVPGRSQH